MPRYTLDKREFLKGIGLSEEIGGVWADQQGIDFYRKPGVLQAGFAKATVYDETEATALTSPITEMQFFGDSAIGAIIALSKNHGVLLRLSGNTSETESVIAFSGAGAADKRGSAMYKIASGNRALFYSLETDIGMYDVTLGFTTEANWDHDFMSTIPASAATVGVAQQRPMYHYRRSDKLYWGDGANKVDQFDANTGANGTLTKNALDLPGEWVIQDFGYLQNYLAILAVTPTYLGSDISRMRLHSKVFFWDTFSDSWSYESPLIPDHLLRLANDGPGLFGVGKGEGLSLYQIGLEDANPLVNWTPPNENTITLDSGRRDGNDEAHDGAFIPLGGQFLALAKDGNDAHVISLGSKVRGMPFVLNKPLFAKAAAGTIDLGDIIAATNNRYYVAIHDDNGASADIYRIIRFSSADGSDTGSFVETVELDSYFGGDGREKTANYIEVQFEPLGATDLVDVDYEKNLSGTWTDIAATAALSAFGGSSASTTTPGTNGTNWVFDKLSIGNFKQLRLKFTLTAGSPKIRRIIVGFDYAPDRR